MAKKQVPFGMDGKTAANLNWSLSVERVLNDIKSDFVYAPHLRFIYRHASQELIDLVKKDLSDGSFTPGLPLHIEVPKTARMKTKQLTRLGPAFSRQGSILLPKDRLLYQAIADVAAPLIKAKTDLTRSFSHRLASAGSGAMFLPTRTCWSKFQKALADRSAKQGNRYVLRTDVANCFAAINQHLLIKQLQDAGLSTELSERLEAMLMAYAGDRSSRGILQGMYPSDLFGNFYLDPVDRFFADKERDSARYVDDVYAFVGSARSAEGVTRELILVLREYGLSLNESKSALMPSGHLITEEPDLETLFQAAVDEISSQLEDEDVEVDYGFQTDWDDEEDEEDDVDLELQATIKLFDSIGDYRNQEENIERFCLPLFTKANSDYAIAHVIDNFDKRPAMAQIYCTYLVRFLDQEKVRKFLAGTLQDTALMDWQVMWCMAALLSLNSASDDIVKVATQIYKDANRHEALRAAAAMFVGRFGDHARRKSLMDYYPKAGSTYLQSAIYFASDWFPKTDKNNARLMWSEQNELNRLLTVAIANRTKQKAKK